MINILILNIKDIKLNKDKLLAYIDDERKEKALKYKQEDDILRSIGSSYFIKKYVGDITYNKYGKPLSDKIFFNISHAKDYVVFTCYTSDIGIDIEYFNERNKDLINYVLNDEEIKKVKSWEDFYYFWTIKESIVKYHGETLSDVKNIINHNQDLKTKTIRFLNYYISVAYKNDTDERIIISRELIKRKMV